MKQKTQSIALIALFTALITVCAWIAIPFTLPITMQTFAVCLASVLLKKKAVFAVIAYIFLGGVGAPVFSGFQGGVSALLGPTGGYVTGFIFTSLLVGFLCEKTEKSAVKTALLMMLGISLCYVFGTVWFMTVFSKGDTSLAAAIVTCVLPFIIPDVLKAFAAATVSQKIKRIIQI